MVALEKRGCKSMWGGKRLRVKVFWWKGAVVASTGRIFGRGVWRGA